MSKKITEYTAVTQPFIPTDLIDVSKHVTQTSGVLIVGKEYTILDFNTGDNFSNVANVISGTINTTGCVFIATGTTPTTYSNGSTLAYYKSQKATIAQIGGLPKVYKALLTQTGTNAPVATVLVNTLSGTPVWSYYGVGRYRLTLVGEFLSGKVIFLIGNSDFSSSFISYRVDDDTIEVNTGTFVPALQDSILYEASISIEVYP